jgi:hypothetical protein
MRWIHPYIQWFLEVKKGQACNLSADTITWKGSISLARHSCQRGSDQCGIVAITYWKCRYPLDAPTTSGCSHRIVIRWCVMGWAPLDFPPKKYLPPTSGQEGISCSITAIAIRNLRIPIHGRQRSFSPDARRLPDLIRRVSLGTVFLDPAGQL